MPLASLPLNSNTIRASFCFDTDPTPAGLDYNTCIYCSNPVASQKIKNKKDQARHVTRNGVLGSSPVLLTQSS